MNRDDTEEKVNRISLNTIYQRDCKFIKGLQNSGKKIEHSAPNSFRNTEYGSNRGIGPSQFRKMIEDKIKEDSIYLAPKEGDLDEPNHESFYVPKLQLPMKKNKHFTNLIDNDRRDSVFTYQNDSEYMRQQQFDGLIFL